MILGSLSTTSSGSWIAIDPDHVSLCSKSEERLLPVFDMRIRIMVEKLGVLPVI